MNYWSILNTEVDRTLFMLNCVHDELLIVQAELFMLNRANQSLIAARVAERRVADLSAQYSEQTHHIVETRQHNSLAEACRHPLRLPGLAIGNLNQWGPGCIAVCRIVPDDPAQPPIR